MLIEYVPSVKNFNCAAKKELMMNHRQAVIIAYNSAFFCIDVLFRSTVPCNLRCQGNNNIDIVLDRDINDLALPHDFDAV